MIKSALIPLILVFMPDSCAFYGPAIWDSGQSIPYSPGKAKSGISIAADVNQGFSFNDGESNHLGRLGAYKILGGEKWNLGLGGYAYHGTYTVSQHEDLSLHGSNSYFGLGPSLTTNWLRPIGDFTLGGGIDFSVPFEWGPYIRTYSSASVSGSFIGSVHLFGEYSLDHESSVGFQYSMFMYQGDFQCYYFHDWLGFYLSLRHRGSIFRPSAGVSIVLK